MEKEKCTLIYNPVSSGFNNKTLDKVLKKLDEKYEINAKKSEYAFHAIDIATEVSDESDLIVSYGGDGTFGEIIQGTYNTDTKARLSHIPIGTANDLRKNFNLSKNPVKTASLIMDGQDKKLDVFTINDVPFSYVSAFGYFANVPCKTTSELKKRLKYLAYLIVGLEEFKNSKPIVYDMTVTHDGETFNEQAIVGTFTNSKGFGGMNLFNNVSLDDGCFEATFVRNMEKKDMLLLAKDIVLKKFDLHNYPELINHFSAEEINIVFNNFAPDDPIDLDGDFARVLTKKDKNSYTIKKGKTINVRFPK